MRKVFIADAHLRQASDTNYRRLREFLATLPGSTETLFIMGDLFEFWIGYPRVPFRQYLPLLEQLRELSDGGVKIVYFEGNHDFHMGPFFENDLGAEIHAGPAILELDGLRVYLCHGDQMNPADYSYRLLRLLFHSRLTRALTRVVPPSWACAIADRLGKKSRANHGRRSHRWDYRAIMRRFAAARFAEGCNAVVTGHFHIPLLEGPDESSPGVLLSLGDWMTHFTYGELNNGRFALCHFPPAEAPLPVPDNPNIPR